MNLIQKTTELSKGHAVAVLLVTPLGIPLIRDPKKPAPVFWKLPGGRGDATETAEECVLREVKEEIGVSLLVKDLTVVHQEDKGNHILTIFRADISVMPKLKQRGNEGEEIMIFKPNEILALKDFFSSHRKVVEKILEKLP